MRLLAIEITPEVPVVKSATVAGAPARLVAVPYVPPTASTVKVLIATMPPTDGEAGVDPAVFEQMRLAVDALDDRVDNLAVLPVGGVLSGSLPSPGFASDMAYQSELEALGAARSPRWRTRQVSANTTAVAFDLIKVDASGGVRTITPPASPATGDAVWVIKADATVNAVVWNAPTNSESTASITGAWSGAIFVWDGAVWVRNAQGAGSGDVPSTRIFYAGDGLSGGGNFSADRTFSVQWGSGTNQVRRGDASVHTDDRGWTKYSEANGAPTSGQAPRWNPTLGKYLPADVGGGGTSLTVTSLQTASYTATVGQLAIFDTSGGGQTTLTLPTNPANGARVGWKIVNGTGGLTVRTGGSDAFTLPGGSTSLTQPLLHQAGIAVYDLPRQVWVVESSDIPLSQLDLRYVTVAQRGPLGGVVTSTHSAGLSPAVTYDVSVSTHRRITLDSDMTLATFSGGQEGQRVLIEAYANSVSRTLNFATAFEQSQAVPARSFPIPAGSWGYFTIILRAGTWRLISAEPQDIASGGVASSGLTPWSFQPGDHGLVTWTYDPIQTNTTLATSSGWFVATMFKVGETQTVSSIVLIITTAGATLTASRNYAGIYNASGALVASTPDAAGVFTSVGQKTLGLTSSVALPPGQYAVGISVAGSTTPSFAATSAQNAAQNVGRSVQSQRGSYTTAVTGLPQTRPNSTAGANPVWAGLL